MKCRSSVTPPRVAMVVMCAVLPGVAAADEFDTFNFNAGVTVMHDDNVFRLSDAADPNRTIGSPTKGDDITVTSFGMRINKPYSLQRFELGLNLVDYKYDRFAFLSFTARNYDAAWRWSLTPRLTGNLTSTRQQTLTSFVDFTGFVRNLRTVENNRFDAVYQVDGVWRVLGGITETKFSNSQVFVADSDNTLRSVEGGVRYLAPSGSFFQLVARNGTGDFFKRVTPVAATLLDNKYRQTELEARANWLFSGKSSIGAKLGWLQRKHENFSQRDYSGWIGNLDVNWGLTGKTRLGVGYSRELASFVLNTSSFIRIDRTYIAPSWEVTSKVVAKARYEYASRAYAGSAVLAPAIDRVDVIQSASVGVDWQPYRVVTVSASLQNDRRSSNVPGLDFKSTTAMVSAQFSF